MKVDKSLLEKYHAGHCNAQERLLVEEWLCSDSDEWPEESLKPAPDEEFLTLPDGIKNKKYSFTRRYANFGVAAAVLCTLGFLIYGQLNKSIPSAAVDTKLSPSNVYHTENGKKAKIKLEDGTEVIMNAASELRVPIKFTDSTRIVYLEGEAYFKVAKDKNRPFTIISDEGKVTVLGTEFNLKAYRHEVTELDIQEGRVSFASLKAAKQCLILQAGEGATLNPQTGVLRRAQGKAPLTSLWKDGGINLENVSLKEIAKIIERRFDYTVNIADDKLANQRYSGSFKVLKLKELLDELAFVMHCKYSLADKQVKFYK
ncbi:FecR family protein [Sphingobacterium sp. Mn56C]|uniref:FecR family protein n=1 Tax=Sphingobacterium sp. Mn56C TaxID=3395261 RepID=UPI003BD9A9DF